MGTTHSVNEIRTAIREPLHARRPRAQGGLPDDAAEIERRIDGYRGELAERP
jgi:hypothetical protein